MSHRWGLLHYAGSAFANAIRLVPRRLRFGAAMLLARAATPFLRRSKMYRFQESARFDGAAEMAVHLMLNTLTNNGVIFDPVVDFDGYHDFVRACREGRGVFLASPHAALGLLSIRINYDNGLRPITITSDPMRIPGTRLEHETIQPSPTFLVTVRRRLMEGRLVGAMVDRAEHQDERTLQFDVADGPMIVAPGLLELAARCGARVAFIEAHVEGKRVKGRFALASSETADALTREFVDFVCSRVDEQVRR